MAEDCASRPLNRPAAKGDPFLTFIWQELDTAGTSAYGKRLRKIRYERRDDLMHWLAAIGAFIIAGCEAWFINRFIEREFSSNLIRTTEEWFKLIRQVGVGVALIITNVVLLFG
jgi:hypothetical protein